MLAHNILSKPEINTPEEIRQIIDHLHSALLRERSDANKSVIRTTLAHVYLNGMHDCPEAKRQSSAALALDPQNAHALELDVATDFCSAPAAPDYSAIIDRLDKLVEQGRDFRSLYSLLGVAYSIRSQKSKARDDVLKARNAYLRAKERNEPEATPNGLALIIQALDEELKSMK